MIMRLYILETVLSVGPASALNVPPHIRSSHPGTTGNRSATLAQGIISQSVVHAFGPA